jgi:hypothetical protein
MGLESYLAAEMLERLELSGQRCHGHRPPGGSPGVQADRPRARPATRHRSGPGDGPQATAQPHAQRGSRAAMTTCGAPRPCSPRPAQCRARAHGAQPRRSRERRCRPMPPSLARPEEFMSTDITMAWATSCLARCPMALPAPAAADPAAAVGSRPSLRPPPLASLPAIVVAIAVHATLDPLRGAGLTGTPPRHTPAAGPPPVHQAETTVGIRNTDASCAQHHDPRHHATRRSQLHQWGHF